MPNIRLNRLAPLARVILGMTATAAGMGVAARETKMNIAKFKAKGVAPIHHLDKVSPKFPDAVKRGAVAAAAAPPIIAVFGTPFMLKNLASQTGTPIGMTATNLRVMFLANLWVIFFRSINSAWGKTLTAEEAAVRTAAEEAVSASHKGAKIGDGLAAIKAPIITAIIAVLDNFIAGLGNSAKMDTLRGHPLSKPQGTLATLLRTAKTATIGSSVRLPVCALQAGFFLSAQPAINAAIMAQGYSKEEASAASIAMTSVLLAMIKNPTEVIQKILLKQAASSPTFARSLVSAAKEAASLHGRHLLTVGLPTTMVQVAIVYVGLTFATELANSVVPEKESSTAVTVRAS